MGSLVLLLLSLSARADSPVDCATEPYVAYGEQETQCLERMRLLMETQDLRGQLVRDSGTPRELEVRIRLDRAESKLANTPCKLTKNERNCAAVNRSKEQKKAVTASTKEGKHETESAR